MPHEHDASHEAGSEADTAPEDHRALVPPQSGQNSAPILPSIRPWPPQLRHWYLVYLNMHPQYRKDREKAERE